MRLRAILLGLLVTLSAVPVGAAPDETAPRPTPHPAIGDGLVLPGQRVGEIRLTMTLGQIMSLLGRGFTQEEFAAEKIILYEWRGQSFWVSLDAATKMIRVISVFAPNANYRTDKGVALLDHWPKAEAVYGQGYRRWEFPEEKVILIRYPAIGLQFGLVNDPAQRLLIGRIFQIGVFKPGDLPPVRQP